MYSFEQFSLIIKGVPCIHVTGNGCSSGQIFGILVNMVSLWPYLSKIDSERVDPRMQVNVKELLNYKSVLFRRRFWIPFFCDHLLLKNCVISFIRFICLQFLMLHNWFCQILFHFCYIVISRTLFILLMTPTYWKLYLRSSYRMMNHISIVCSVQ